MKLKNEDDRNWMEELVDLIGKDQSPEQARIIVEQARLTPKHYELLCERLPLYMKNIKLTSSWQLELLTGEACYFLQHTSKEDNSGKTVVDYAFIAGVGADILKIIRNKKPSLMSTLTQSFYKLLYFALSYENTSALQWLVKETPDIRPEDLINMCPYNSCRLLQKGNWTEGLEIAAEHVPSTLDIISWNFNQLYKSPKLCEILKKNNHFPFSFESVGPLVAVHVCVSVLTSKWEHEVPIIEWCRDKIPGFIIWMKEARNSSGQTVLHELLDRPVVDRNLFTSLAKEVPELLDIKDKEGNSLAWQAACNDDYDLFKFVHSFNKDSTFLEGISFKDEDDFGSRADDSQDMPEEEGFDRLNKALNHVHTIQSLGFTGSTKKRIEDYLDDMGHIPTCFYSLVRNKLLVFILGMTDTNSLLYPLSCKLMDIIFNKLVEVKVVEQVGLIPPPARLYLNYANRQKLFQVVEKSTDQSQVENTLDRRLT